MNASGGGRKRGGRGARRGSSGGRGGDQQGRGRRGGGTQRGRGQQGGGHQGGGQQRSGQQGGGKHQGGQAQRRKRDPRSEEVRTLEGPLSQVLARLPETQRRVVEHRMGLVDGHPANLADTARAMGMTMHEAKQVEQRAFEHIREAIPTAHLKRLLAQLG